MADSMTLRQARELALRIRDEQREAIARDRSEDSERIAELERIVADQEDEIRSLRGYARCTKADGNAKGTAE